MSKKIPELDKLTALNHTAEALGLEMTPEDLQRLRELKQRRAIIIPRSIDGAITPELGEEKRKLIRSL